MAGFGPALKWPALNARAVDATPDCLGRCETVKYCSVTTTQLYFCASDWYLCSFSLKGLGCWRDAFLYGKGNS